MLQRLFLGSTCALLALAGCGGGDTMGTDSGTGGNDTGVPPVDTGVPPVDTGTPGTDAAMVGDAGTTDGCELGNTFPDLAFAPLHSFADLPVTLALAPGRDDIFVVERAGRIVIMNPTTGAIGATPFLDVHTRIGGTPTSMDEYGLLGLAFHPDYETNGLLYIAYTAVAGAAYEDRVAVATRATADTATFGSDIFTIPDPRSNHNGGQLGFGPDDGYLYYGVGDGGEQGDPHHRAQDTTLALGKIHRFEVGPGIATYNPAPGNPFIGGGGLATIWAYGVRNPWRFTWDRRTHDMYIGDVGQNAWEEVDYLAAGTGSGTNFGWSICEGTHDFNGTCTSLTGDVLPIAEYSHSDPVMSASTQASITGGFVYRGSAIPALRGAYLYADEISSGFSALRNCPGTPVTPTVITSLTDSTCQNPVTFGEDRQGELLVSCLADATVYRIVAP